MKPALRRPGRPRTRGAARAAIVSAADALFYERGVDSVPLDEIARTAGVTRRTLYYHFEGKDQLVIEHVRLRDDAIQSAAKQSTILDAFTALERLFCDRDYKGCAITNVAFSGVNAPPVVGRMTERHKREMEQWFIGQAKQLKAREPEVVGRQLMLLYEGAAAMARVRRDRDIPRIAKDAAKRLLRSANARVD
ncbi:MAG: helix-turn-helix transcriptional regulator [Candidatus Eremiobacteraeota bacterium]|nr:helix-turn-helix transcriptional regulator [Candidatus Eremiobacteraeota bacterium]